MARVWERKRGNASGRNGSIGRMYPRWYCDGCGREHGGSVARTTLLDGRTFCDRTDPTEQILLASRIAAA